MRKFGFPVALAALAALVPLLLPSLARACFVCFGGEDSDWTGAFVSGTVVMLGLPPAIILGATFVIYRSVKRTEALRAEQEESSSGGPTLPH